MNHEKVDIKHMEKMFHYRFKNKKLLRNALIHRSYTNEHREEQLANNERLEFLGDAVLEIVVSDYLYRTCEKQEGDLSRMRASIVCEQALASWCMEKDLGKHLILGHGEDVSGGRYRPSVLSDALEAIFGAIYIDGGFAQARRVIKIVLKEILANEDYFVDNKTKLQEVIQEQENARMEYRLLRESGPDHGKVYEVAVMINGKRMGVGSGSSKKAAQQKAAAQAMRKLMKKKNLKQFFRSL
ncbi:MAG: ribonuclease III [Eubacteriales bacterium]|nr:ribonuclease III [Eubacteriales bacterium]